MLYMVRQFLTISSLPLLICVLAGCKSEKEKISDDYNRYTFDPKVIEKLPLYDSLAFVIIENFPAFQKFIKDDDSYRSFRYMPTAYEPEVFNKLPAELALKIDPYYNRIDTALIYGFDVFKDSSIKIYIRESFSLKSDVDIWESLSYYPAGNIRHREFPDKDSILNKHWQYWTRFRKRGLLFDN